MNAEPALPAPSMPSAAVMFFRIPPRDVRQSDGRATSGDAGSKPGHEYRRIGRSIGDKPSRDRGDHHHTQKKPSSPVPVGPHAKHDPHQRAGQKRGADEQPEFRIRETVLSLNFDANDREDRPYGKTADVTQRGHYQHPPAEALERIRRVLGLSNGCDLSGMI